MRFPQEKGKNRQEKTSIGKTASGAIQKAKAPHTTWPHVILSNKLSILRIYDAPTKKLR